MPGATDSRFSAVDEPSREDAVDFVLPGVVGIRVIGGSEADVAGVERQIGPLRQPLVEAPDITIRFTTRLDLGDQPLRYATYPDAAFNSTGLVLMRGSVNARKHVLIPFADVGGPCTIVAEHGATPIPLLVAVINFTALAGNILPLHASAVLYGGRGVLVTGWSKGGKTETVLALTADGARYVGDEWVYITADGESMRGLPEPIRLWAWHVRSIESRGRFLRSSVRRRLRTVDLAAHLVERLARGPVGRMGAVGGVVQRAAPIVRRQAYVQVPPRDLFSGGEDIGAVRPDLVVLAMSHASTDTTIEAVAADEVVKRMSYSLRYERQSFMDAYLQYRYAFPDRPNPHIDSAHERESALLRSALGDRPTVLLRHPYPVDPAVLAEALRRVL